MSTTLQLKRTLAATWTTLNTVLAEGEVGVETDTLLFKIGDGVTAWTALAYAGGGGGGSGTVTSVAASVPTGLSVAGSPITTAGTLAITYQAGYQGFLTTESSKLAGIAAGATVNSSDATLLARANHTGTQLASTVSDFAAAVAATAAVTANTAKVTNATHTGDVTGATALTIADDIVTNAKLANVATSTIKGRVTAATGDPEDLTAAQVRTLINVANGATANSADATLLARANHTGTQAVGTITGLATVATSASAADLTTGLLPAARFDDTAHGARAGGTTHANVVAAGAAGFMTGTDKTKLDGVATGATANSADATLLARANHTGTQTTSTLSDFNSTTRAQIEASVLAGANITITPAGSGATRTFTIASTGGGGVAWGAITGTLSAQTDLQTALDAKAPTARTIGTTAPLTGGGDLTANRTLAIPAATAAVDGYMTSVAMTKLNGIATGATANSADATLLARANHTGTQAVGTITGLAAVATSGSATDLSAGTLPAARFDDTAHGARAGGTTHANVVAAGAAGFMTGADKTKLDGVATGATANATDASLRDRATHTGAQATSTVTGLDTALADRVKGTPRITVGTTAPGSPAVNDLWVDTN